MSPKQGKNKKEAKEDCYSFMKHNTDHSKKTGFKNDKAFHIVNYTRMMMMSMMFSCYRDGGACSCSYADKGKHFSHTVCPIPL